MLTRDAGFTLASTAFSSLDFSGGAIVAVSGGSDSTALLILLKAHFDRFHPTAPLLAVTVDHALRPGSADEAATVARFCAARGVAHRTLVWSGPKPPTGLPQVAREARYRLLALGAREAGVTLVATGHTADDQAETVLMRQARSTDSEEPGLAGMAPATLYEGRSWIVRPLLGVRREALRTWLRGEGVAWVDDPSNADMRFERPRVRADRERGGVPVEEALAIAHHAARHREDLGRRAARLIRDNATQPVSGLARLDPVFAHAADGAAAVQTLRILLAVIGGTTFLPAREKAQALLLRLGSGRVRATLSRCVIDSRRSGIFLHREGRSLPAAYPAEGETIWDGRRRITFEGGGAEMVIEAAGRAAGGGECAPAAVPSSVVKAALSAEPRLRPVSGGVFSGHGGRVEPLMAPWRSFLPSFDLAPARAAADLIGAPAVADSPFCDPEGLEPWSNA